MPTLREYGNAVGLKKDDSVKKHLTAGFGSSLKRPTVAKFILRYCEMLREEAGGRVKAPTTGLDPEQERARKDKLTADLAEHNLSVSQGKYILAEEVKLAWGQIGVTLSSSFQGLPDKLVDMTESIVYEAIEEDKKVDGAQLRIKFKGAVDGILEELKT